MSSTVIMDSHYFGYRTMWATGRGELTADDVPTGVMYGILMDTLSIAQRFGTGKFIFSWDSRKSLRKEIFPGYKNRATEDEDPEDAAKRRAMYDQLELLRTQILPEIGFKNHLYAEGYESDDLMAELVLTWEDDWIMACTDNDMYQMLDHCIIWRPDNKQVITAHTFRTKYGIEPRQWAEYKAIAGCTSDTVPGVHGMGEKYTLQWLRGELKPGKKLDLMRSKQTKKTIKKMRKLVKLPFKGTPEIDLVEDDFDKKALDHWCDKFKLRTIKEDSRWMMFLNPGLIY
jgi:5'-3' exonuclease